MAYRLSGQQKLISFGAYPAIGLAEARLKRDDVKKLLATGIDPAFQAKQDKAIKQEADANTFGAIAEECLAESLKEGKGEATLSKKRWLTGLAVGDIVNCPIGEITAREIPVPLRKMEAQGNYETARRLRTGISQVFRVAMSTFKVVSDPTFGPKDSLVTPKVTYRSAATNWDDFER